MTRLRVHSHLAQLLCTMPKHDYPPSKSPTDLHSHCSSWKWAGGSLLLYIRHHIVVWSRRNREHSTTPLTLWLILCSFGHRPPSHIAPFLDHAGWYIIAWLHSVFKLCTPACACTWATIPCLNTLLSIVPGPRKCTVHEHSVERSHYSNKLDMEVKHAWARFWLPIVIAPKSAVLGKAPHHQKTNTTS